MAASSTPMVSVGVNSPPGAPDPRQAGGRQWLEGEQDGEQPERDAADRGELHDVQAVAEQ